MNSEGIKAWLKERGMSQADIANLSRRSRTFVWFFIHGLRESDELRGLLLRLGCPPGFLVEHKDKVA